MSLETKVMQWLTRDEQLEFLLREKYWSQARCLAITSDRAILFRIGMFGRMKATRDIRWRQLADVQVKEHFTSADLTMIFRSPRDCLLYHDPHHHEEGNHESSEQPPEPWQLLYLRRREAKEAYRLLKAKQHQYEDILRGEHLEHDRAIGPLGPLGQRYVQMPKTEAQQPPHSGNPPLTS